jgi:phosphoribosylformylglycinamidine cyclo-ligase
MRHGKELTYRFHTLPPVPEVLQFLQQQTGSDDRAAYGNLNMGAGYALFVAAGDAARTVQIARDAGVQAWAAGVVEAGHKQVVLEPLGLGFGGDDLHVRA